VRILADENIDKPIVDRLRAAGHEVVYVVESMAGTADDRVFKLASQHSAVLLTADKDFGEIVFRQRRNSGGVILVRLAGVSPALKASIVAAVIDEHGEDIPGSFTVIGRGAVRIRKQLG
jgi:predicted nuclease of predicted toxin-antitoxin system